MLSPHRPPPLLRVWPIRLPSILQLSPSSRLPRTPSSASPSRAYSKPKGNLYPTRYRGYSTFPIPSMSLPLARELTAPNGVKYIQPLGLFINNVFVKSSSGDTISVINPTNEEEITSVYAGNAADIDLAVAAARAAFDSPEWSEITPQDRGGLLFKLADLVESNAKILATIERSLICHRDNGKPYKVCLEEDLGESVSVLRYYAGWADKIYGRTIDVGPQKLAYTLHQPIGVCGQIIPWNYPMMAAWKLGPALATGNTVILKSAEQCPLSALYLAQLVKDAGFPPGVVNIITGYGKTAGAAMTSHPGIDKIAFTGSTATGRHIMKAASADLKNITLETGGKSPLIVFEDADLEQAVKWSHIGIMSNMGQVCSATSRILVHEKVYDAFVEAFKIQIQKVSKIGDPFAEDTFQGPQVSKVQFDQIMGYINSGISEGATIAIGGTRHTETGYFISPTAFINVTDEMRICREEIFGPVVTISSFKTDAEALRRANDTTYGLGAAIFTENITKAHRIAAKIQAGMVWINSSNDSHFGIPFGGVKQSGIGRELGEYALTAYTNAKAIHVNLGTKL
ncbi:aldehyde dehydrogenase [Peziza echinospora]|nr:aldehyde dehydrogenase [Peziza echinospora]